MSDTIDHTHKTPIGGALERGVALVDLAESLMASGKREGEIIQALGYGRRKAMRIMALVRRRWVRDGMVVSREQRKAENREVAVMLRARALEKTRGVARSVAIGVQVIEQVPDPDIRSAIEAHRLVCEMDGDVQHDTGATSAALAMQLAMILGIEVAGANAKGGGEVIDAEGEPVERGRLGP